MHPVLALLFAPVAFHWSFPQKSTVPVAGHCSARIGSCVYVFGGLLHETCISQVRRFDGTWKLIPPDGESPPERMYAASAPIGDEMMICGGWDPGERGSGGVFFDDIWVYTPKTNQWRELSARLPDGPVSRHVAVAIDSSTVLIHSFRCDDHILLYDSSDDTIVKKPTRGAAPPKLSMMSATYHPESRTIVFSGGTTKDQKMSDSVFLLDTRTWTWSESEHTPFGKYYISPEPSASAAAIALPRSRKQSMTQLVFGGASVPRGGYTKGLKSSDMLWILEVDGLSHTWSRCFPTGIAPESRVGACLDWVDSNIVMLHGGWQPESNISHSSSHFLDITDGEFS